MFYINIVDFLHLLRNPYNCKPSGVSMPKPLPSSKPSPKALPKQKLVQLSEISLSLDTYDDIFSDFDPRPFHLRAISDDFLAEARKAVRNRPSGGIELRFIIPAHARNTQYESTIKERLHRYFSEQHHTVRRDLRTMRRKAVLLTALGIGLMIAAAYVRTLPTQAFSLQVLYVLFDPAGWFSTWFGLERLVHLWTTSKPELDFNHKMARCEITFASY